MIASTKSNTWLTDESWKIADKKTLTNYNELQWKLSDENDRNRQTRTGTGTGTDTKCYAEKQ